MKIKDERQELEKLLKKSPGSINKEIPDDSLEGLHAEPLIDVDFDELRDKCEDDARTMINNAIIFIIPAEAIEENPYLRNKLEVDVISLSGLLYQLRTNEIMQKTLIEQVNSGMAHPRMFEVFAGMSKTIGEINKQLIQTVEAIKETYKSFREEAREKKTEALGPSQSTNGVITTGDGSIVTRGTKELINMIKDIKRHPDILDVEEMTDNESKENKENKE